MVMNIKVTDYCTASNSSMGVNEAIKNMQSGDTLLFPTGEYHFYKDFSIHKVCYMTNTDSFKAPDKYFAINIENAMQIKKEYLDNLLHYTRITLNLNYLSE